ncbi:MAG: glycosyltransferase [Halobacteriovoraceae bacterium]|jgi:glycosyltransferase involved in cell wall biosynthesis|nr:glycosyltransferase [Halobacteriovoraceae bacterium]MBT5096028.1 glycosyltransferase [Halobacteriovoraceae bacterium]
MVPNPFFSVIIPTYNRSATLRRAIDSVLAQSYQNFELIVVDDGSQDQTPQILEEYLERKVLSVITTQNKGVSCARNCGVQSASGNWLAFLDSDDEWLADKLERQSELLLKRPELSLIHGEEIWIRNGVRVNQMKKHQKFGGRIFEKCLPLCLISPSAVVLKSELYHKHGGFREDYPVCEDYDLWLKITAEEEVGFISDPLIKKYGGHSDQLSAKYFAMDYWRIKSMVPFLNSNKISREEKKSVNILISKKSTILLQGYLKHSNLQHYEEISSYLRLAQKA